MDNLIKTVEIFLAHSEEKLEELAEKNQALKQNVVRLKSLLKSDTIKNNKEGRR